MSVLAEPGGRLEGEGRLEAGGNPSRTGQTHWQDNSLPTVHMFSGYRIRQNCQSGTSEESLVLLHKYLKIVCCFHDKKLFLIYSIHIVLFCQTIFKCLILIGSQKAYLKNRQLFHPHFYPLWPNVVTTT